MCFWNWTAKGFFDSDAKNWAIIGIRTGLLEIHLQLQQCERHKNAIRVAAFQLPWLGISGIKLHALCFMMGCQCSKPTWLIHIKECGELLKLKT